MVENTKIESAPLEIDELQYRSQHPETWTESEAKAAVTTLLRAIAERDAEIAALRVACDHKQEAIEGMMEAARVVNGKLESWKTRALAGEAMVAELKRSPVDARDEQIRMLHKLVQGECPKCGQHDLHSARVSHEDGVICCECDWASSYSALAQPQPKSDIVAVDHEGKPVYSLAQRQPTDGEQN